MSDQFRKIDLATWDRKKHYDFFCSFADPTYSVTTEVQIKGRVPKQITAAVTYAVSVAANQVEAFRFRQHGNEVILWNMVSPSITLIDERELFKFCFLPHQKKFTDFARDYKQRVKKALPRDGIFDSMEHGDAVVYVSCVPWFSFTGLTHPTLTRPPDTIPRFAWGKIQKKKGGFSLDLNFQLNHKFIDGIHVAKFLEVFRATLSRP